MFQILQNMFPFWGEFSNVSFMIFSYFRRCKYWESVRYRIGVYLLKWALRKKPTLKFNKILGSGECSGCLVQGLGVENLLWSTDPLSFTLYITDSKTASHHGNDRSQLHLLSGPASTDVSLKSIVSGKCCCRRMMNRNNTINCKTFVPLPAQELVIIKNDARCKPI